MARNPTWIRDELILALDLYLEMDFGHNSGHVTAAHPRIVALSKSLNALPVHRAHPDAARFRNPNGVYMKLCNFLRLDPEYPGRALEHGANRDKEVWNDFTNNRSYLRKTAAMIMDHVQSHIAKAAVSDAQVLVEEDEAPEGRLLTVYHKLRERNPKLSAKKKALVKKQRGFLSCEVCDFIPAQRYGPDSEACMECHHMVPLSQLGAQQLTRLRDLAIVCANCHRILHSPGRWPSVADLRQRLASGRPGSMAGER